MKYWMTQSEYYPVYNPEQDDRGEEVSDELLKEWELCKIEFVRIQELFYESDRTRREKIGQLTWAETQ